jgi:hypothetical protein
MTNFKLVRSLIPISSIICLGLYGHLYAQPWSGIIGSSRAMDWSGAGVSGGIPGNRTTNCATLSAGATAAQINSAIAACPSGQVVSLGAGTFSLSTGIVMKSNVTLRGAGSNQTFLSMTGLNSCTGWYASICVSGSGSYYGGSVSATSWTAGYAKGSTQLTVASAAGIAPGATLTVDQADDTSIGSDIVMGQTATTFSREGGSPGRPGRAMEEYFEVTGVNGNVLTVTPPVRMPNWNGGKSPHAFTWGTYITGAGIENLSIDHSPAGPSASNGGIVFFIASNCWLKGVRSLNGPRNHAWLIQSKGVEVRDSYFFGSQGTVSQSYAVESFLSSDSLVINNIFQHVTLPMMIGPNVGGVYAYNFSIDNNYNTGSGSSWQQPALMVHDGGVGMVLIEGNVGQALESDLFHGTSAMVTSFRNRFSGFDTGRTQNTIPIQTLSYHRYYNHVGNVLGTSGKHTQYQDVATSGTGADSSVFVLGWGGQEGGTQAGDPASDPTGITTTTLRWGNYDTANGAARFVAGEVPSGISPYGNPVPAGQTLPASFFLSSRPGWWPSSKPWPPIGPDVTGGNIANLGGHAYTLPAQDCFSDIMGGASAGTLSALTFNPASCYGATSGGGGGGGGTPAPPAPPTNLTAVTH